MKNPFLEFQRKVHQALKEFVQEAESTVENFYKDSFKNQGFTDRSLVKWKGRKIRRLYLKRSVKKSRKRTAFTLTKEAKRANHAILIGPAPGGGKLRRSIKTKAKGLTLVTTSGLEYAQVHNEGGKAGRGKGFLMIQRQYMGDSEALRKLLANDFYRKMDQVFK